MRAQAEAFVGAVVGANPAKRVPTCPEWRLRDLVAHIGQACRWTSPNPRRLRPDDSPIAITGRRGLLEHWLTYTA